MNVLLWAGGQNSDTARGCTTELRRVSGGRTAMASTTLKEDRVQIQNDSTTAVSEGTNYIIKLAMNEMLSISAQMILAF